MDCVNWPNHSWNLSFLCWNVVLFPLSFCFLAFFTCEPNKEFPLGGFSPLPPFPLCHSGLLIETVAFQSRNCLPEALIDFVDKRHVVLASAAPGAQRGGG